MRRLLAKYPVIYSWCNAIIGECEIANSHGICQKCADKMLAEVA